MTINKYNFLEHPEIISTAEGRIELTYDALGNKLQKRVYAEGFNPDNFPNSCATEALMNQQDYLLDYLYRWHYPETAPQTYEPKFRAHRFYHEEGSIEWRRINQNNTSNDGFEPCFQYTIRDHLGNGRVYFTKDYNGDGDLDILQESHYYPFGAQIAGLSKIYDPPGSVPNASNNYVYAAQNNPEFIEYRQYTHDLKRYNGKEFNRELGLNWYDYGARWYDPVIGRWNAVDPLAEKFYGWSPFNYVYNNPIAFIDPTGMVGEYFGVFGGEIYNMGNDGQDDGKQYLIVDNSKFSKIKKENSGDLSSEEARTNLQKSGAVKEIEVNTGNTTEGAYFQNLFDRGMGDSYDTCDENGCELLLNTETAQLQVHTNTTFASGPGFTMSDDPKVVTGGNENIIIMGSAHTHQAADFFSDDRRPASAQMDGDGKTSATAQKIIYSYDSRNVHKITPTKMMGLKRSVPHDNIAPTSNLYNGNFSILRDALRTVAKSY